MKSIARVVSILVVLVLLASISGVMPVAAVTGTVTLQNAEGGALITTPAGVLTVTVNDADLNTGVLQVGERLDLDGNTNWIQASGLGPNGTQLVFVQKFPILDGPDDDSILNRFDVTVTTSAEFLPFLRVIGVDSVNGLVTLQNNSATLIPAETRFYLTYTAADVQATSINIDSTSIGASFDLTLQETGPDTGVFTATVQTATQTGTTVDKFAETTKAASSTDTVLRGTTIREIDIGVDVDGDGETAATEAFAIDRQLFHPGTTNEALLLNAVGAFMKLDIAEAIDGTASDGEANTAILPSTTFTEVPSGLDLNGNGVLNETGLTTILNFALTVNENVARIDGDGDGVTDNAVGDIKGVDLDGDGFTTTTLATGIDVSKLPNSLIRPTIVAGVGAIITGSYVDADPAGTRVGTASVETTDPVITVVEPADGSSTQTRDTLLIADVTDFDSGVIAASIRFNIISPAVVTAPAANVRTTAISGGFRADVRLVGVLAGAVTDIVWQVTASDEGGNLGRSDSDAATAAPDTHALRVDLVPPVFADPIGAITGQHFDADGAVVTAATSADRNKIRVIFDEDIEAASVGITDLTVDGVNPLAVETSASAPNSVVLTVSTLSGNAKPDIALTGVITDTAGNSVSTLPAVKARDGIAPTLTVIVSPTLDTTEVDIEVSADEPITVPTIQVNGVTLAPGTLVTTQLYTRTFDPTDEPNVYSVVVVISDTTGNTSTAGVLAHDAADVILFEIDDVLPAPTTIPADEGEVFVGSPVFVEIDWTSEGTEYGLDVAGGALATTSDNVVVDLDTHNVVTLTSITLNGVDVSDQIRVEGDATFLLAAGLLAEGAYVLVFNGEDEAGNVLADDLTVDFTVADRPVFSIPMTTGWNLISLPGAPLAGKRGVNDVIPLGHPIDTVTTYDPTQPQKWLIAQRLEDGTFETDEISEIELGLAYWVRTTGFESLDVTVPGARGGTNQVLPTFRLVAGWNLLPVIDVTGDKAAGDSISKDYLEGLDIKRIYEYRPTLDRFEEVADDNDLQVGKGYWVWVESAGTVVP